MSEMSIFLLFINFYCCISPNFETTVNTGGLLEEMDCQYIFYRYNNQLELIAKEYRPHSSYIEDSGLSVFQIIQCGVYLANDGDSLAKKIILTHYSNLYEHITEGNNYMEYPAVFMSLDKTLGKLKGEEAFEIALHFFSRNVTLSDCIQEGEGLGGQPNTNFGLMAFESVILAMIDDSQKNYYKNRYKEIYQKYQKQSIDAAERADSKKFHELLYAEVKTDWDAGKIKLQK